MLRSPMTATASSTAASPSATAAIASRQRAVWAVAVSRISANVVVRGSSGQRGVAPVAALGVEAGRGRRRGLRVDLGAHDAGLVDRGGDHPEQPRRQGARIAHRRVDPLHGAEGRSSFRGGEAHVVHVAQHAAEQPRGRRRLRRGQAQEPLPAQPGGVVRPFAGEDDVDGRLEDPVPAEGLGLVRRVGSVGDVPRPVEHPRVGLRVQAQVRGVPGDVGEGGVALPGRRRGGAGEHAAERRGHLVLVREAGDVGAAAVTAHQARVEEHVRALRAHLVGVVGAGEEPAGVGAPHRRFRDEIVGEHVRHPVLSSRRSRPRAQARPRSGRQGV